MREKKLYYTISVLINILICICGSFTILIGMFCMSSIGLRPNREDFIIGLIIYIGTYLIAGLINFVIYKLLKNKLNLGRKYFIMPTICVYIVGLIYTLVLLL